MEKKAALVATRAEIARLSAELEKAKSAATDMKARFVEASKKQKETLDQSEARAHHAETGLALLRSQADTWLSELTGLNRDLNSKLTDIFFLLLSFFTATILMT